MLKINELRIGNIIQYKKGHIAKIIGIEIREEIGVKTITKHIVTVKGIENSYIDGVYEIENFKPLNITHENIFKLGFIKTASNSAGFKFNLGSSSSFMSSVFCDVIQWEEDDRYTVGGIEVNSIHEFQNAFYFFNKIEVSFDNI